MTHEFREVDPENPEQTRPVEGATAYAIRADGQEVHVTTTDAQGVADWGILTYQQVYRRVAFDSQGRSTQGQTAVETEQNDTAPQDAPTHTANGSSSSQISMSWGAVSGATGYEIAIEQGTQTGDPATATPDDVGDVLSAVVSDLDSETTYTTWVRAYNAEGPGPWSDPKTATTQETGSGVVITESFDKTDGPGLGPDLTWTELPGYSFETINGQATGGSGLSRARAEHDMDTDEHFAECEVTRIDSDRQVGLLVRMSGTNNDDFMRFVYADTPKVWRLAEHVGGESTILEETPTTTSPLPSVPFTMRLEIWSDGVLRGIVNGSEVVSATPNDGLAGNKRVGINIVGGETRIDNFVAGDL